MRTERKNRAVLAGALLLPLLFNGVPGTEKFVLCFGSDGHVAVEAESGGRCMKSLDHPSEHSEHALTAPRDDHAITPPQCGDCIDLPMMEIQPCQVPPVSERTPIHDALNPALAEAACPPSLGMDHTPEHHEAIPPPGADAMRLSLFSVILLI